MFSNILEHSSDLTAGRLNTGIDGALFPMTVYLLTPKLHVIDTDKPVEIMDYTSRVIPENRPDSIFLIRI